MSDLVNHSITRNNFTLYNKFSLSNQPFEISKLKFNNEDYLFVNTESPFILYFLNNIINISNFNFKNCEKIFNIESEDNLIR